MITEEQINEKAKQESIAKVTDYAPYSYKAGFADGAKWILELWKTHTSNFTER